MPERAEQDEAKTLEALRATADAGRRAEDELIERLTALAEGSPAGTSPLDPEVKVAAEAESELTLLLLHRIQRGGSVAQNDLFRSVETPLRPKAVSVASRKNKADVGPTMLMDSAFLDLLKSKSKWVDRKQFLAYAGRRMRQILIDAERKAEAIKNDPPGSRVDEYEIAFPIICQSNVDFETRLRVLKMLRNQARECYEAILLRFYLDLSVDETADVMGVHPNTVTNKTKTAFTILKAELDKNGSPTDPTGSR